MPNLNKKTERVPISSVVLSSQRVRPARCALHGEQKTRRTASNPLVEDGQKLIPSVTRVFSQSRDMYVYLQAYERGRDDDRSRWWRSSTFYRGRCEGVRDAAAAGDASGIDARSKAVPLQFSVSLAKLPPGQYNCQVTVLDPTAQKAAFWQAPIVVVQYGRTFRSAGKLVRRADLQVRRHLPSVNWASAARCDRSRPRPAARPASRVSVQVAP